MAITSKKNPDKKYSYADYCSWNDENRYEIIDGVVYDMNAPLRIHQEILLSLARKFADYFDSKNCKVYLAPFDVRLPKRSKKDDKIDTVVQPDISVICDETKLDERGCIGAPDLAIEILSPSTAGKDHIIKKRLYETFGVKEYWLIHPTDRIATVYRLNENKQYGASDIFSDSDIIEVKLFPGLTINLSEIFPLIDKKVSSPPPSAFRT